MQHKLSQGVNFPLHIAHVLAHDLGAPGGHSRGFLPIERMTVTRIASPIDLWTNTLQAGFILAEANAVITMRVMGMAGLWSVAPSENGRMISEKVYATTKAMTDSTKAAMTGARPDQITAAAMKPIRQKTRTNAKRLAKRGPKTRM